MTDIKSKSSFDTPRRKFYEEAIINHFKRQYIATEKMETVSRALEGKRQEVENYSYSKLREDFVFRGFSDFHKEALIIFAIINNYISFRLYLVQADLDIYLYKDIKIEDIAAIYIGVNPDFITYDFIDKHKSTLFEFELVKEYLYILGILKDGIKNGFLKDTNSLLDYRNFLLQFGIIKLEVKIILQKRKLIEHDITDLEFSLISTESVKEYQEIKTEEIPKQFKELAYSQSSTNNGSQTTRKLNNLLKLLYYMAEDKYGHEKGRAKETATKLETLSGNSKQTIEKWLEDAGFLIEDENN